MHVKYKGHKAQMPVYLPIGAKTKSTIRETKFANPLLELSESDAKALVELDPHNFEIYDAKLEKEKAEDAAIAAKAIADAKAEREARRQAEQDGELSEPAVDESEEKPVKKVRKSKKAKAHAHHEPEADESEQL